MKTDLPGRLSQAVISGDRASAGSGDVSVRDREFAGIDAV
jgi:hypothetical protein